MRTLNLCLVFMLCLFPAVLPAAESDDVRDSEYRKFRVLAAGFFEWRRSQQPAGGDDIPRVERPDGWVPEWSPEALETYRETYREYLRAVESLDTSNC